MLPGPQILSTLGTVSVPYAIAAIACAPPILYISVAPAMDAAARMTGAIVPSFLGGVAKTILPTPATEAGMTSIRTVDGRGAVPPGT